MVSIITYISVLENLMCLCERPVHYEASVGGPSDISKAPPDGRFPEIVWLVHLKHDALFLELVIADSLQSPRNEQCLSGILDASDSHHSLGLRS